MNLGTVGINTATTQYVPKTTNLNCILMFNTEHATRRYMCHYFVCAFFREV